MKKTFLSIILLAMALVVFQCTQKEAINPDRQPTFESERINNQSFNAFSLSISTPTCTFDANRSARLGHLHQQVRVTTKGVTGFTDQLYTSSDGVTVDAGPLRFTAPNGEVEVGGGEGYGVTTQPLDGNTNRRKLINNGETLVIQTRNTADQILRATLSFKFAGGANDRVTIKASNGNKCVGEKTFDLTDAELKTIDVCFGYSFTKLEITADANSDGITIISGNQQVNNVWVDFPSIFYMGKEAFAYSFLSSPINFEQGALTRANLNFPGGDAVTTALGWEIDYGNNSCGTGNVYRYYLRRQDTGEFLAGVAGNNGLREPNSIFAYKRGGTNNAWAQTIPFVLLRKYHGNSFKPAIATPNFVFGYPNQFNQARFESPVNNLVSFTDANGDLWEARQGDINGNNTSRIYIYRNGSLWGRTNGAGENGTLTGFTVLKVRTANVDNAGKIDNVYEYVPFALIQHPSKGLTLQTGTTSPAYGSGSLQFVAPIQEQLVF